MKGVPRLKRFLVLMFAAALAFLPCVRALSESEGADDSDYGPGSVSGGPGSALVVTETPGGPGNSVGSPAASAVFSTGQDLGPGEIIRDASAGSADTSSSGPGGPSSSKYAQPRGPLAPKQGYKTPETLATVPSDVSRLSMPGGLPDSVGIVSFTAENGTVLAELDHPVPKLRILELTGTDDGSTIFSRKDAAAAETHATSKGSTAFRIQMIWEQGQVQYVREYNAQSSQTAFFRCTATEKLKAEEYAPYTSAVRTIYFNEDLAPISEVISMESEDESYSRIAGYDAEGKLAYVRQTWCSLIKNGYLLDIVQDSTGQITAISYDTDRADYYIRSQRADGDLLSEDSVRMTSRDISLFDEELRRKYPSLGKGLAGSGGPGSPFIEYSTPTDLATATDLEEESEPLPENARIWSLSYRRFPHIVVYVFTTEDPVLVMKNGRVVLNSAAKDLSGNRLKISQKLKSASPSFEPLTIE